MCMGSAAGVVSIGMHFANSGDGEAGSEAATVKLPFDRERIRQFTCIMVLNMLRMRLIAQPMSRTEG